MEQIVWLQTHGISNVLNISSCEGRLRSNGSIGAEGPVVLTALILLITLDEKGCTKENGVVHVIGG